MTSIQSTQLDFENIKSKLKTFLAAQPEFADYNFEGSGLSNILDVLAYNTHYNGLIANFALNETFLTTAQLRSSVVSHAETLGYNARSKTASVAYVNIQFVNTSIDRSPIATLPAYSSFTTSVDGATYVFQTLEPYTATDNGVGVYRFQTPDGSFDIPLYEGNRTVKNFLVGDTTDRQIYVIPNSSVDTNTLDVKVYTSTTSSTFSAYTKLKDAVTITPTSKLYTVHESPNGFWEVHFSDGLTTGAAPTVGNKIVITYLSTAGEAANGATSFTPTNTLSIGGLQYALTVLTASPSSGGTEKESIESIRSNAPIVFGSQQRLVTALDYQGQILSRYPNVVDAIAWGGETNIPAYYGKVLVSLKFADGVSEAAQTATKNSITSDLSANFSIMSIDTMFQDPVKLYIGCQIRFNYDTTLSNTPINVAEIQVANLTTEHFAAKLNKFNSVFRRSNLLTEIDDLSPAILNSQMDVVVQRRFTPTLFNSKSYTINFPVPLAIANGTTPVITSNYFTHNGVSCRIVNEMLAGSMRLQLKDASDAIVVDNIGSFTPSNGVVSLVGFEPTFIQAASEIKINAVPANQATVRTSNNFLIELDPSLTFARGVRE